MRRLISVTESQIAAIEQVGLDLIRQKDERASTLLSVVLAYRCARGFVCDVDESAGMAEVAELNGYSKRVP